MALDDNRPNGAWTIIIPVKETKVAKTRLIGLSGPVRAALALAFALDAATAALCCPRIREVLVVTNDRKASRALTEIGVRVVPDIPDAGLNAALVHGVDTVRRAHPQAAVAAMSGDLPALRSEDLDEVLVAGAGHPRWFVADADGTGTTLLAASGGSPLLPAFGEGSRAAHTLSGAVDLVAPDVHRLRRDVDTEEHLWDAVRLGVGAHTRSALADLALVPSPLA